MDQLFKQFAGAGGAGGTGGNNFSSLFSGAGAAAINSQINEDEEILDEEAQMDNVRVYYDIFVQNSLKSTSHTVQWLPMSETDPEYSQFNRKYFLLGTHNGANEGEEEASVDPDEMYIGMVRVPKIDKQNKATIDYSRLKKDCSQIQIVKSFKHDGDVSKARAMKQDWKFIASILSTGDIGLYRSDEDWGNKTQQEPVATLRGLESEGFGLSWNPIQQGLLIAATGTDLCLWDTANLAAKGMASQSVKKAHEKTINDVKFSNMNPFLFGTASDDNNYKIWDMRALKDSNSFIHCNKASEDDLLVISFNQKNEFLFATGGEQSGIFHVWDTRMPRYFLNDLVFHKSAVSQIEWDPFSENLFMSSGTDGGVFVWDNNKSGEEQARHDYEDGPPEMIFPHETHRKVNIEDICWSPTDEHQAVSIDTQMVMQVWKMSEDFFFNELDYQDRHNEIKLEYLE